MSLTFDTPVAEELERVAATIEQARTPRNRIAVYCACLNSYDAPGQVPIKTSGADFFFISDNASVVPEGWVPIRTELEYRDPRRAAKVFKLLPHLFLPAYEISVWVDANRILTADLANLVSETLANASMASFAHNKRTRIVAEAAECIKRGKGRPSVIRKQVQRYREEFGDELDTLGLRSGCFLLRRHNEPDVQAAMVDWWREVDKYSVRDQLSFPVIARRSNMRMMTIPGDSNMNPYFTTVPHSRNLVYTSNIAVQARKVVAEVVGYLARRTGGLRARLRRTKADSS